MSKQKRQVDPQAEGARGSTDAMRRADVWQALDDLADAAFDAEFGESEDPQGEERRRWQDYFSTRLAKFRDDEETLFDVEQRYFI